jgi:HK97 family phage major capsid protein
MSDLQKKIAQISAKSVTTEGEKWVRLIATAPTLDRDLEVIDTASLHIPIKPKGWKYAKDLTADDHIDLPLLYDHEWSVEKQLGSVRSMFINADGELETVVGFTSLDRGMEAHTLAKEGHLGNSFSGTFDYSTGYEVDGVFYDAEMIELSMVFKGANRDARVLEVSKAVKKEGIMDEATKKELEEKKALAAKLTKEISEAEAEQVSEEDEAEKKAVAEKEAAEKADEEATKKQAEAEEAKKLEEDTKIKEENMNEAEQKAIAAKSAAAKKSEVEQTVVTKKISERDRKVLTVKQIRAMLQKNFSEVQRLNKEAEEFDTADAATKAFKKKAISYTEGDSVSLYLCEQLERDIDSQYGDYGNVGTLVTRIRLTTSPNWRRIIRTDGVQFMKPGFVGVKGEDEPTWVSFTLAPKPFAVIVGWNDHVAEDAYISMYDEIVRDIAEAQSRLEDELILIEDGETAADGTVYPVQGLVPILTALGSSRLVDYTYDTQFVPAMAEAYGKINSAARQNLSLVMNGTTWGRIALLQDTQGRPLWQGNGQNVALGALGNVRIVTSDVLPAGTAILGNFRNYTLAEKEGLELMESRHATVGSINAFTQDFTFLRAVKRLEGGTARTNAFVLLQDLSASS